MTQSVVCLSAHGFEGPAGWAKVRLGEVYELSYGKGLPKRGRNTHGPYPVYGANGVVGYHDSYLTEGPVLIIGRKGTAGAVWFSYDPCWPIDTTYYVCDTNNIDIRFSFHLFTSLRLHRLDRSTAIPGLNTGTTYMTSPSAFRHFLSKPASLRGLTHCCPLSIPAL